MVFYDPFPWGSGDWIFYQRILSLKTKAQKWGKELRTFIGATAHWLLGSLDYIYLVPLIIHLVNYPSSLPLECCILLTLLFSTGEALLAATQSCLSLP